MSPYAETAAEIAAVEDDVDELRELIEESDRLLNVLEALNLAGRKTLTDAARRWTVELGDRVLGYPLPADHEARWKVQKALDHVFDDVQKVLFRRHLQAIGFDYIAFLGEPDEAEP